MRTTARNLALLLSLAVAASFSCSKTQDSAPERRIFGEPPIIQNVDLDYFAQNAPVVCDFTDIVFSIFCNGGVLDVEPQTGFGWTVLYENPATQEGRYIKKEEVASTVPGVLIAGVYSELNFKATVVDPNSTPGNTNVLLVASSYIAPESSSETSLVLFDDGSEINFKLGQRAVGIGEDCRIDVENAICVCDVATYDIQSGDEVKDDGTYTRRFTFINPSASNFLYDCVMRERHSFGIPAPAGTAFNFKIEAVDRQGNLTVWPTTLPAVTGTSTFGCTGDSCGCCMLHAFSQQAELSECKGEPGMISPSQFPNGFCVDGIQ